MANIGRENNFDLIRLIASIQVVLWHSYEHLHIPSKEINQIIYSLRFFHGVPVFFCVSGFLIYASFERSKGVAQYFKNRILRIFPGLWAVFVFTVLSLIISNYLDFSQLFSKQIIMWSIGQVTIFQFYTPDILRQFGVGAPNGSLWTIFIEFSFYAFVPIFYLSAKKINKTFLMLGCIIASLLYNYWYNAILEGSSEDSSPLVKLLGLNLIPYLFYFLGGAFIYEKWDMIKKIYINKGMYWLIIYLVYCLIFSVWLEKFAPSYWPNMWGIIATILLFQTIISLAYTNPKLSSKLLKNNDISYGFYLFHMPVVNLLLFYGYDKRNLSLLIVLSAVTLLSFISWKFIEKPALKLKNNKINLKLFH